jgi:hypothetical protein
VKLLNSKFKVKIYIILVLPSSAVLKPAQAGLVLFVVVFSSRLSKNVRDHFNLYLTLLNMFNKLQNKISM